MQTPLKTKFQEWLLFNSENGKWPEFLVLTLIVYFLDLNLTFSLELQWKQQKYDFQGGHKKKWYIGNSANDFLNLY